MAKKEIEFTESQTAFEWHAVEGDLGGLTEKILSIDPETGDITRLLRFPKGYEGKGVLYHPFWEEIYILEGYGCTTNLWVDLTNCFISPII